MLQESLWELGERERLASGIIYTAADANDSAEDTPYSYNSSNQEHEEESSKTSWQDQVGRRCIRTYRAWKVSLNRNMEHSILRHCSGRDYIPRLILILDSKRILNSRPHWSGI